MSKLFAQLRSCDCNSCVTAANWPQTRSRVSPAALPNVDVRYTRGICCKVNYAYDQSAAMQAYSCHRLYSQRWKPETCRSRVLSSARTLRLINIWFNSRFWFGWIETGQGLFAEKPYNFEIFKLPLGLVSLLKVIFCWEVSIITRVLQKSCSSPFLEKTGNYRTLWHVAQQHNWILSIYY